MITQSNRFHGLNSLSGVYRKGQTVSLPFISLKYLTAKGSKPYRLAVVVSRKVDKSAVVRNRIRRRIYELIRIKSTDFILNVDMVISVHSKDVASMKASDLNELIKQLLLKAALIKA